jgi:hypothetical protein
VRAHDDAPVLDRRGDRPSRGRIGAADDLPGPPALFLAGTLVRRPGEAAVDADLAAVAAERTGSDEGGVVVDDADERLALLEKDAQRLVPGERAPGPERSARPSATTGTGTPGRRERSRAGGWRPERRAARARRGRARRARSRPKRGGSRRRRCTARAWEKDAWAPGAAHGPDRTPRATRRLRERRGPPRSRKRVAFGAKKARSVRRCRGARSGRSMESSSSRVVAPAPEMRGTPDLSRTTDGCLVPESCAWRGRRGARSAGRHATNENDEERPRLREAGAAAARAAEPG